jgi:cytochrome c
MKRTTIVMMAALALGAGASQASEELAKKSGCLTCHNVTGAKKLGPPLAAAAGKGEAGVVAALNDKKKHGSVKATDDDKKALAKWIVTLK